MGKGQATAFRQPESYHRAFTQLCHVVPLNKTGKVREVVDSLVLTCFGVDSSLPLGSAVSVAQALDVYFGVEISVVEVQRSIDRHLAASRLLPSPARGRLMLAPATKAEVEKRIEEGNQLEGNVKDEWVAELQAAGLASDEIERLWACLRTYMAKAFCQHGVLTVQMLDPGMPTSDSDQVSLRALLEASIAETCSGLDSVVVRQAVSSFFETSSAIRSRYVAQMLDATFTFFALKADDATVAYLRDGLSPLKLFLDTNFIFGLLDLHENPTREVSKELITLIKAQGFPFTLHFHERTLKELRDTIDNMASRLRDRQWSPSLSQAACTLPQLSGLELAYHRLNAKSPVNVGVFLSKFDHLEDLLGDFGVALYRDPAREVNDAEAKGLLVAEYQAYAKEHRPLRPKTYGSADHDMGVLLTLDRLRQKGKSPLDVGALFLSVDFLLWEFDRSQLRGRHEVGRVILPAHLMQLLRPFANASQDFDQRFVEAFAIPEFRSAHDDYRETTSLVLSYLTSFKDVPEPTAVRILTDELLLGGLRGLEEGSAEFAELMERALEADHLQLSEENLALKAQLDELRTSHEVAIADAEQRVARQTEVVERTVAAADAREIAAREAERALAEKAILEVREAERIERERLEAEVGGLASQVAEQSAKSSTRRRRNRYFTVCFSWLAICLFSMVIPHLVHWHWLLNHDHRVGIYLSFFVALGSAAWAITNRAQGKVALSVVFVGALFVLLGLL